MGWTYRVVKETVQAGTEFEDIHYYIAEAYDDGDKKNVTGYTSTITPSTFASYNENEDKDAAAIEGLRWQLDRMLKALDEPILDPGKVVAVSKDNL